MVITRIRALFTLAAALTMVTVLATGCTQPAPTGTAATPRPAASPAAAAKPPVGSMTIIPVAANKDDPNVIPASLPGTTTTVMLGNTGLTNLTIGAPVTFKGGSKDATAPAKKYAWTLTGPTASKAALSAKDTEVVKFTPDVPGVYKVDLVVSNDGGNAPMTSMQIQAGTFIGTEKGNCKSCHSGEAKEWADTGHASIMKWQIDGGDAPKDSHYGEGCLRCHTVGYSIGVANGGFADLQAKTGWKFPALAAIQSGKGNWDAIPAELKNMANIQCENCHGPAKDHVEKKAPMDATLDEGVCNVCHNGGGTHIKGEQFKYSKHSHEESVAWNYPTGPSRQACVRCHSGAGYISFLENPTEPASWDNSPQNATCSVCHDPHSDANKFQLRIVGKPVEANGVTKDYGLSATCTECHNARTQASAAAKGSTPHYSPAAEMLAGTGGVEYGAKVANSPHGVAVGSSPIADPADKTGEKKLFGGENPGPCVACHMWPTLADAKDPNRNKVGSHSFNMVSPDGNYDYTAACQSCHSGVKDFNLPSKADYDGNGKVETVQAEVAGMLKVLQTAISDSGIKPVEGHPYFDAAAKAKATEKQNNAIYNYLFVRGLEGSDGKANAVHNFKRSIMLLQLSYKDLTGKDVPNATLMQ